MRPSGIVLLVCLASCAGTPPVPESDPPAALAALLNHPDPARREEAAARLSIRGWTIAEALEGKEAPRVDEDGAGLRKGVQDAITQPSPELMVRRAWHALRLGCLAREAKPVSAALGTQGFRLIEIYEPTDGLKFTRYLAQASAYVNGAGDRHDLFCWTQAVRRQNSTWTVREVYVGLHAGFDAPFKTVAAIDRYPRGSVLGKFLELPELQKVALVFPLLEEIEFTYGRIRDKGADGAAAGFHVNAGFVMEGLAGGRGVYYTAEAGLDPRETLRGRLDWSGFASSDAVGPLVPRGTGFWGAGGPKPSDE